MLLKEIYIEVISLDETTYTFKEICEKTGYKASVIRFYEKEFKLNIPRDTGGRRIFTRKELDKLMFIKKMQEEGYSNLQIKRVLNNNITLLETAITNEAKVILNNENSDTIKPQEEILKYIDEKFNLINSSLNELNSNVGSKERDLLLSENLKLKMEIKQRAYEIIELKEKLRYERDKGSGIFKNIFKKK